jgi:hypothetical protein
LALASVRSASSFILIMFEMLVLFGLCSMCSSAAENSPQATLNRYSQPSNVPFHPKIQPPSSRSSPVLVTFFVLVSLGVCAWLFYIFQPNESADSPTTSAIEPTPTAISKEPREIYVTPPTPTPPLRYRYVLKSPVSVRVPYGAITVPAKSEVRLLHQTANTYHVQSGKLEFDVQANQLLSIPQ